MINSIILFGNLHIFTRQKKVIVLSSLKTFPVDFLGMIKTNLSYSIEYHL